MKIGGRSLGLQNQKSVTFYRLGKDGPVEYTFLVVPLPWGWEESMQSRGLQDYPEPPKEILKDAEGKFVVNPDTKQVEYYENMRGPKWRRKFNVVSMRIDGLRFREYLREDSGVMFDTKSPGDSADQESWIKYGDKLLVEIKAAGFTEGEFYKIIEAGRELSVVESLEDDAADFLPRAPESSSNGRSLETPTADEKLTETRTLSKD